jgi:hypothetical protein
VVSALREYAEAMEAGGQPLPASLSARPDGQLVADVFPLGLEALLFGGWHGQIWIEPGKPASQVRRRRRCEADSSHALLKWGSCVWQPNRAQISYCSSDSPCPRCLLRVPASTVPFHRLRRPASFCLSSCHR